MPQIVSLVRTETTGNGIADEKRGGSVFQERFSSGLGKDFFSKLIFAPECSFFQSQNYQHTHFLETNRNYFDKQELLSSPVNFASQLVVDVKPLLAMKKVVFNYIYMPVA
jgi:hypothetical protein